jgi:hypothetical protein
MNKSNVTNIQKGSKRSIASVVCNDRLSLNDDDLMGWLIYRSDTEEFLYSHKAGVGYTSAAYVKEPALAYLFDSERLAFRYSTFINKKTEVVPLFDIGDKLAVGFS